LEFARPPRRLVQQLQVLGRLKEIHLHSRFHKAICIHHS
jgi:hypothetical protein